MTSSETKSVVVSFEPWPEMRPAIEGALAGLADVTYLAGLDDDNGRRRWRAPTRCSPEGSVRSCAWTSCASWDPSASFRCSRRGQPRAVRPSPGRHRGRLQRRRLFAADGRARAPLTLALAKCLPQNHAAMASGVFDQRTPNRELRGAVVAILGYGGIGRASATLFRALGARIHAVTRSGAINDSVDRAVTLAELDSVLEAADVTVISLPLTRSTRGLIGARELALMKPDAILVNVARAEIVDEDTGRDEQPHLRADSS